MGKITARNATLSVDGTTITPSLNSIVLTLNQTAPEITVFETKFKERMTEGIKDWELKVDGYYEYGAGAIDTILFGLLGASCELVFGPSGSGTSSIKYSGSGVLSNYELGFQLEDAATISATFQAKTGSMVRGSY